MVDVASYIPLWIEQLKTIISIGAFGYAVIVPTLCYLYIRHIRKDIEIIRRYGSDSSIFRDDVERQISQIRSEVSGIEKTTGDKLKAYALRTDVDKQIKDIKIPNIQNLATKTELSQIDDKLTQISTESNQILSDFDNRLSKFEEKHTKADKIDEERLE